MAKQYSNNLRGALFINHNKETRLHPDQIGKVEIDGKEFWAKGWFKIAGKDSKRAGETYLSMSFTPCDQPRQPQAQGWPNQQPQPRPQQNGSQNGQWQNTQDDFYNDDIPY